MPKKKPGPEDAPRPTAGKPSLSRDCILAPEFREDLLWWVQTDQRLAKRIIELMNAIMDHPFEGIGKPEPLRGWAADTWSRRINEEHRLVYHVGHDRITFLQCRYHYSERGG